MENINKNEWEDHLEPTQPAELVEAESKLRWALYCSRGLIAAAALLLLTSFGGLSLLLSSSFQFVIILYFAALICNIVQARLLRRYGALLFDLKLEKTKLYKRARIGTTVYWVICGLAPLAASPLLLFIGFAMALHPMH
jgi:hypothetical protein